MVRQARSRRAEAADHLRQGLIDRQSMTRWIVIHGTQGVTLAQHRYKSIGRLLS
jgi:hypothetical protein